MTTLKERLKKANELKNKTFQTVIIYWVCCEVSDTLPIDLFKTIEESRECIKGISNEYKKIDGRGIKMYIVPKLVDDDTFEDVTDENFHLYDNNGQFVKELKEHLYN
jgi:hypothetical protein